MKKGLFITFEGIDGCGKTTQINLLKEYLENKNYKVILTFEPGGSDIGKHLRQILLHHDGFVDDICETFLYLADRAQHVQTVILDNLNKGNIVLCDRYTDSTIAYQGYGRGHDTKKLEILNDIATKGLKPDITFLSDIDVETAQKRIGITKDRLESLDKSFHNRVREGYIELYKNSPDIIKKLDGSKTIEEIFEEVKLAVDELL